MSNRIKITPISSSRISEVDFDNIPFGRVFSDHMFVADYIDGKWTNVEIKPFGRLDLHPANMALHYGQSIFEGMKIFKNVEGTPVLFRPEMHAIRMNKSAVRMAMPEFPQDLFLEALQELIKLDYNWIPEDDDSALYVRPYMFATDEYIGVQASKTYKYVIFTCPVGPYYDKPVKLLASDKYIRAAKGGVGGAKTAGNYAASIYPAQLAKKAGYDQVLWLDGVHFKYLQESGTMNLFVNIDGTIITPPTEDFTILEGITRDSFLHILKGKGYKVEVRNISIDEVVTAYDEGKLKEVFGSGTAAVVAFVKEVKYQDKQMFLDPEQAEVAKMLKAEIIGIRKGTVEDTFGWITKIDIPAEVA